MERKLRIIVCGTTFGQFYLEALKLQKDKFEVVGLLAKGSERSKICAENYNISLYTNIEELPEDIDLACVVLRTRALGGNGTNLACELLERGINVIHEQPIHPKDLELCYRVALKNNVYFQTGNLYPNLPEVRKFIECAKELNKIHGKPAYVNASFAPQVSYPAMDILMHALPSIRKWDIHSIKNSSGPFDVFTGKLGDTPITLEIHNEVYPKDPDNNMYLLHNIVFIYESGRLTLEDTFGPAIWNPRMNVPTELYNRGDLEGEYPEYMSEKTVTILGDFQPTTFKNAVTKLWPAAVSKDLLLIRNFIINKEKQSQKSQKEMLCSLQWNEMTKIIGYADILNDSMHKFISTKLLKDIAEKI